MMLILIDLEILSANIRDKVECGVFMLASVINGRASVVCMASKKQLSLALIVENC